MLPTTSNNTTGSLSNILISQYYEGASFDKYIELWNSGSTDVSLSGYRLTMWANAATENWKNGTSSPSQSLDLSAVTIPAGGHYLLAHSSAANPLYASSATNQRNGSTINFSGNDSVVLYSSSTYSLANILDVVSFTNSGNEGIDKSFYRLSDAVGVGISYSLNPGEPTSNALWSAVWGQKSLADVASATPADAWYLTGQAAATAPSLDTFTVASDVATTVSPGVTLTFTNTGAAPTSYLASEDPAFTGATWLPFVTLPRIQLSSGNGVKTVYLKLRNAAGESTALSDTIEITDYVYPGGVQFTQYYLGSSNNKYLEITNTSGAAIDLAGWSVVRWTNADAENWKYTGAPGTGSSQTIPLTTLNTGGTPATSLAPGQVIVIGHSSATAPVAAASLAFSNGNFSQNGNDSLALYSGAVSPANLVDVISFTDAGNQGAATSFVRLVSGQGFSFAPGSNITGFPTQWSTVTTATVDTAASTQNEYLGTWPGSGLAGYALWASAYPGIGLAGWNTPWAACLTTPAPPPSPWSAAQTAPLP